MLRAIIEVMMNRPDAALKDLSNPSIGDQHDAPLWRAMAFAGQGKWAMASDNFKRVEASVAALPVELQREPQQHPEVWKSSLNFLLPAFHP